jgi:hypothetical protein
MIKFLLKKNFVDGWDNMFQIILFNLLLLALCIGGYFAISAVISNIYLSVALFFILTAIIFIPIFSIAEISQQIACFESVEFKDFFRNLPKVCKVAIPFGLLVAFLIITALITFPFYAQNESIFGFALLILLFWIYVFVILSLQWFCSLYVNMHGGFFKTLKKCFLFFIDNFGFSIFFFFYSVVLYIISFVFVFLVPSVAGVMLAQCNAVKLRMYKYDWLEKNQEEISKSKGKNFLGKVKIPWAELIAEDKEQLGHRTVLDLIFPWR